MKTVVSFSGGMDSATLLWELTDGGRTNDVLAVSFVYGSKHNEHELVAAAEFTYRLGCRYRVVDLSGIMAGFKSDLLKSGGEIPEGHYEAESMERTVVPARNIIFASVLAGIAWSEGASQVALAVHAGDHAIYPDCRPEFVEDMGNALWEGTGKRVGLHAPYLNLTKAQILKRGLGLNVPYELTRTCYTTSPIACGKCGSCQERLEAFALNSATDPLEYQSRDLMPKESK
jgi:7-cyano-7-deazaguanine synthase